MQITNDPALVTNDVHLVRESLLTNTFFVNMFELSPVITINSYIDIFTLANTLSIDQYIIDANNDVSKLQYLFYGLDYFLIDATEYKRIADMHYLETSVNRCYKHIQNTSQKIQYLTNDIIQNIDLVYSYNIMLLSN